AAVVAEFGPAYVTADGALDRERLAALVFADPDARARLNAIVHPLVGAAAAPLAPTAPPRAGLVHDVPLLGGTRVAPAVDVVVVVDVAPEVAVERLVRLRGMSRSDAEARIAAQASRDERLAVADHVVRNDGTLADLATNVDELWQALTARQP